MRLHETFKLDNAAITEAFQHDPAVVRCQLDLLEAMEELRLAIEAGNDDLAKAFATQIEEIIPRRNALLLPYQERAEEEDREIRLGPFKRSIEPRREDNAAWPEVKLTVLRRVPQRNAWACRIENGFAVEFPEGDLVSYHISFPKRGRKS